MNNKSTEPLERVWDKLVVSINSSPVRLRNIQGRTGAVLFVAVCCMFFLNYRVLRDSTLNSFVYNSYQQLANPSINYVSIDAWDKIYADLQKEK